MGTGFTSPVPPTFGLLNPQGDQSQTAPTQVAPQAQPQGTDMQSRLNDLKSSDPEAYAAVSPMFTSDTTRLASPTFDYTGINQTEVQKATIQNMQQLYARLDPNSDQNKQLQKQLQRLQYTPEKRAQDIINQRLGKTVDDQGKTHTNWLKFGMGMLGEALQGANQKGNYIPLWERAREQATKEYTAEATPAVRDLLYEQQERRNLQTNITGGLRILNQSQQAAQNAAIKEQMAKVNTEKANEYLKSGDARIQLMAATAKHLNETDKVAEADAMLKQAETLMTQSKQQQLDVETKRINAGLSARPSSEESEISHLMRVDPTLSYEDALQRVKTLGAGWDKIVQPSGVIDFWNRKDPRMTQQVMPPGMGGQVPQGTPQGSTYLTDPVLKPEPLGTLPPGAAGQMVNKAKVAYPLGKGILQRIDSLPDDQLGNWSGAYMKYIQSNFKDADPKFAGLLGALSSYGAFMSGIHTFRNKEFVDEMKEQGAKVMTNKDAMKAWVNSFQDAAVGTLRDARSIKNDALNPNSGYDYNDIKRIWHPSLEAPKLMDGKNVISDPMELKKLLGK